MRATEMLVNGQNYLGSPPLSPLSIRVLWQDVAVNIRRRGNCDRRGGGGQVRGVGGTKCRNERAKVAIDVNTGTALRPKSVPIRREQGGRCATVSLPSPSSLTCRGNEEGEGRELQHCNAFCNTVFDPLSILNSRM